MVFETRVTKLLGIEYPIIQGGLAHLAYSELAAAVSEAGGLGQVTAMSLGSPEELKSEIRKVKEKTDKPFGVNFAIGQYNKSFEDMVEAAVEEQVSVISITGGNPKGVMDMVEGHDIKKLVLVASLRQAEKAEELGADAVMVVGQEGGGHLGRGDIGTFVLTPQVAESLSIPVIASGGITDGKGLMAALSLGAEGIEMGTRFIATRECFAHDNYKKAIIEATENDTVVIKRSIGAPARVLKGAWAEKILEIEKQNGGYESLKDYISGKVNKKYIAEGDPEYGFGWAGQSSARINDIPTVDELIKSITKEANKVYERLNQMR